MPLVKKKMEQLRSWIWCVVLGLTLATPTLTAAEPWLQFCESDISCGYKNVADEVKIEPRHLYRSSAPKVITDEMRLINDLRIMYFPGEKANELIGYLDAKGETVIPPIYERHFYTNFSDGYAIVKKDGMLRLINKAGELSPLKAQRINTTPSNPPAFIVKRNDKWEVTDFDGKSVNDIKYPNIRNWDDQTERLVFKINDKFGVVAYNGEEVFPAIYDGIEMSNTSFSILERDGQKALFNTLSGDPITDFIYDDIYLPSDGRMENNAVVVVKNGKTGLIDFNGTSLLELKYDRIAPSKDKLRDKFFRPNLGFSEGRALFFKGNRAGYLDQTGAVVISNSGFLLGERFKAGTAEVVLKNAKRALIDKTGNVLLSGYKKSSRYGDYLIYCVKKGDKCGIVNRSGQVLIKPKYSYLYDVYDDEFTVFWNKKGKKGLLKFDNKVLNTDSILIEIVPAIFDKIEVKDGFVFVTFGSQKHPMQLNGTPIGFSLIDVAAAE